MESGSIITWNATNWITIVLMAAIGYAALSLGVSWWKQRQGMGA